MVAIKIHTKVYKSLYLVLTILLLVAHLNFRLVQQFSIQGYPLWHDGIGNAIAMMF